MDKKRPTAIASPKYFTDTSFLRKIKRRIKAPDHKLILKVPPFFAQQAAEELILRGICEKNQIAESDAGIEISGPIDLIYKAHAHLAVPSRVLLVVDEFRAGAAEELFRKSERIPWELYIHPGIPLRIRSRVRNSRIEHEGAAGTAVLDAVRSAFAASCPKERLVEENTDHRPAAGEPVQNIHISIERNHCRIAIDTSGEHLHKRGYRTRMTEAPIRETIGAGFLLWVLERIERPEYILDPMCGSGTFPIESALLSTGHSLYSSQQNRSFLFEAMPWHRPAAWEYAKKQEAEPVLGNLSIFGADIESSAVESAGHNAENAGCADNVKFSSSNFFTTSARDYPRSDSDDGSGSDSGLIITNLPYGIRRSEGSRSFFSKFYRHCRDAYPGWTVACICPQSMITAAVRDRILFYNGGIRVQGVLLDI